MEVQIDLSESTRTKEQNAKLERYYQAAKILRATGFKVRVFLNIVTDPKDEPAGIELRD